MVVDTAVERSVLSKLLVATLNAGNGFVNCYDCLVM